MGGRQSSVRQPNTYIGVVADCWAATLDLLQTCEATFNSGNHTLYRSVTPTNRVAM